MRWLTFLAFFVAAQPAIGAKTFVYCSESSPSSFGPSLISDSASANNTNQVHDTLVDFERGTTKVIPSLAEKWEISKDGLTYTFHLRKNVSFHTTTFFTPTRNFNADDVLFTFNRQRLANHPFHKIGGAKYEVFDSLGLPDTIKDIVKVDDYTVRFILNHPEAAFLSDVGIYFVGILSQEYGDKLLKKGTPEKIDLEPIGTGAFSFVKYDKDQTVRFKAHPKYFRGKPKIENLVFSITPDASVRYQKLKSGECHFIAEPGLADLGAMKSDPALKVTEIQMLNLGYLALNTTKKPLDNLLVRKAIYHALNRKSYLDAVYLGHAVLNKNPLPILQWSFNKSIKDYEYDPEKAKSLLKEAGLPNGFTLDLWTLPVSRAYNPNGKRMGEMMQADLAKVGITVTMKTLDWPSYLTKRKTGDYSLFQFGWNSDNGDPDNFLYYMLSCDSVGQGANQAQWCYKPYDDLVTKAKRLTTQAQRTKLYEEAQVIFHEQVPFVPIATAFSYRGMSKKVKGYKMAAVGVNDYFDTVDLE